MTFVWSLRLALYLYRRVMGHHPVEDGRYQQLRQEWAPHVNRCFFWFFQAQGLLNLLLSAPLLLACANPSASLHPLVTGIPMTEEQALKSRGDDYREYQRTTSAFFPWVPRV